MSPSEDTQASVAVRLPVVGRPRPSTLSVDPPAARRSAGASAPAAVGPLAVAENSAAAWSETLSLDPGEESFLTGLFSDRGPRVPVTAACNGTLKSFTKRMHAITKRLPDSPRGVGSLTWESNADARRLHIRRLLRDAASKGRPGPIIAGTSSPVALPQLGGPRPPPSPRLATMSPRSDFSSPRVSPVPREDFLSPRGLPRRRSAIGSLTGREVTSPRAREEQMSPSGLRGSRAGAAKPSDDGKRESLPTFKRKEREACESIRQMLFGRVGNESSPPEEKHLVYELRRGSQEEVAILVERWFDMDESGKGEVDLDDFAVAFKRSKSDRFLVDKCLKYFSMVLGPEGTSDSEDPQSPRRISRKSTATLSKEDMMRLIWLKATDDDVAAMGTAFDLCLLQRAAVEPPPLIPRRQRRQLLETFKDLDFKSSGEIPFVALAEAGLADEEMCRHLQSRYDTDGTGTFTFERFLEMMCPYGFRAHERVTSTIDKDGRTVSWVTCFCGALEFRGWMTEDTLPSLEQVHRFSH